MNRTEADADEIERIVAEYRRRAAVLPATRDSLLSLPRCSCISSARARSFTP